MFEPDYRLPPGLPRYRVGDFDRITMPRFRSPWWKRLLIRLHLARDPLKLPDIRSILAVESILPEPPKDPK